MYLFSRRSIATIPNEEEKVATPKPRFENLVNLYLSGLSGLSYPSVMPKIFPTNVTGTK